MKSLNDCNYNKLLMYNEFVIYFIKQDIYWNIKKIGTSQWLIITVIKLIIYYK